MSKTVEYQAWAAMWARCTDPNHIGYDRYKGYAPPDSWKDFAVFFQELGKKPTPEHSLDRIKNEEPYGPGNCKWSTMAEQNRNQSSNVWIEFEGKNYIQADFADHIGAPRSSMTKLLKTKTPNEIAQHYRKK